MRDNEEIRGIKKMKLAVCRKQLSAAEVVIVGAGAGLSASAGFDYTEERFSRYFHDFGDKYGFADMYSGGFYPYQTLEEYWAYWSRYIWINRYQNPPKPVYNALSELMQEKKVFCIDHQCGSPVSEGGG